MLIDKSTKKVMLENIEIKRIMSEGGVLWEALYDPIPDLLESDIKYDNFSIRRNNVACIKKLLVPENKKILVNCNYVEMGKIFGYGIDDKTQKFISNMAVRVYFENSGYLILEFNNNTNIASPSISESRNDRCASMKKLSEFKCEISLIKNIKYVYIDVHFYGDHEVSKSNFLKLCKQCDIKIEIV